MGMQIRSILFMARVKAFSTHPFMVMAMVLPIITVQELLFPTCNSMGHRAILRDFQG